MMVVAALVICASGEEGESNCEYCANYMGQVWEWSTKGEGVTRQVDILRNHLCTSDQSPSHCNETISSTWETISKDIMVEEEWTPQTMCEKDYKCADPAARVIYPPTSCNNCKAQVSNGQKKAIDEEKIKETIKFLQGDVFCGDNAECDEFIAKTIPLAMRDLGEFFVTGMAAEHCCRFRDFCCEE